MSDTTQTLNLLPCPFCGSKSISEQFDDGLFWVKCSSCGSTGPANTRYSGTDGEEVRDWNTRGVVSQGEIKLDEEAIKHVQGKAEYATFAVRGVIVKYIEALKLFPLPKRESQREIRLIDPNLFWEAYKNIPKHACPEHEKPCTDVFRKAMDAALIGVQKRESGNREGNR